MLINAPQKIATPSKAASKQTRLPRRTGLALAFAAAFGSGTSQVQAQNQIIPTGKTATQLQVNGNVTNITTGTIKGLTAFNSFSRFEVDHNNTVNLILPPATQNLVNLVTDRAIEINGVVNSLRDGRIGGNVIFADPNGMLVGAAGVLNVGSLTALTPSQRFMDGVIGVDGSINDLSTASLLRGDAERASGGLIRIDGQVNALEQIHLNAAQINIGGTLVAGADASHRAAFAGAVNAGGLQASTGLTETDGVIELVADSTVLISGSLDVARRDSAGSGGSVTVMAQSIELLDGARIDASGTGGGGQIGLGVMRAPDGTVLHAGSTVVNGGASLAADAIDAGDGGQIRIWGEQGNRFAGQASARGGRDGGNGGLVEVSSLTGLRITGAVDTAAAKGIAGTLLIDPDTIQIVDGLAKDYVDNIVTVGWLQERGDQSTTLSATTKLTVGSATDSTAANVDLSNFLTSASATLTLNGGAELILNSGSKILTGGGNIELTGQKITLNAGSVIDTTKAGNIKVTALSEDISTVMGNHHANASILVNGTLTGKTITLSATAKAEATTPGSFVDSSVVDATDSNGDPLGFKWVEGVSTGRANVTIGSSAILDATGNIDITATGSQISKLDLRLGDSANPAFNSVAVHGGVVGGATALIESGAHLTAGTDLSVKAINTSTLDILAKVYSYSEDMGISFAYGESTLSSSATIQAGAQLDITRGIDVVARNTASSSVQASSSAWGKGKAGIAAVMTDSNIASDAIQNANVTASGNVRVQAETVVSKNFNKAETATGSDMVASRLPPTVMDLLASGGNLATSGSSILMRRLSNSMTSANQASGGSADPSTTSLKIGSALSLVNADFSAHASIGAAAKVESTAGDVLVYANVEDHVVHNIAQSSVNSATTDSKATATDPAAQYSASAGVALAFLTHDAQALIGKGAVITANAIAVDSNVSQPLDITWAQWDGFSSITDTLKAKLNSKLGVPEEVLTSYANASASATDTALAGSLNWFDVGNTSRAWVDQSAQLHSTGTSGAHTLALQGDTAKDLVVTQSISIAAHSLVETVDVAGNLSATLITGTGGGADTTAVGGAFAGLHYANTTTAGVDDDAHLSADNGGIAIRAESDDKAYVIAPSTGGGSSISGNGAGAYTHINNLTQAALSNRATVNANGLDIAAQESMSIWAAAGAVNQSSGTAVGASIALNDLQTTTNALIGDVSALRADPNQGNVTVAGSLELGSGALNVSALTQGQAGALSVAAALAKSEPPPPASSNDPAKTSETKAQTDTQPVTDSSAGTLAAVENKVGDITQPLSDAQKSKNLKEPPPDQPKLNVSAAGSASVNHSTVTTSATITGAHVTKAATLDLTASNNTNLIAVSGGAALTMAGAPSVERSGALAGAVAINIENGNTLAGTTDGDFTDLSSVGIHALSSGQHVAVAMGLASTSQTQDSTTLVGSVSLAQVRDNTEAFTNNSIFTTQASGPSEVKVLAYDGTLLGIGGGALANGGSSAVGVALSLGDVSNTVSAQVDGGQIHGFNQLTVAALSPTTIVAAAMEVAGTKGKTAAGASAAATLIRNHTKASINAGDVISDQTQVLATDSPTRDGPSDLLTQTTAAALHQSAQNDGQNVIDFKDNGLVAATPPDGASIVSIAGSVQAGAAASGASLTYNDVQNETSAKLSGTAVGQVDVRAADRTSVISVAFGVAVGSSGNYAGVGSATVNMVKNTTLAQIGNDDGLPASEVTADNSQSVPADLVNVVAISGTSVWTVAGSAAQSKSGSSTGAAIADNKSDNDTQALLVNAKLTATQSNISVKAKQEAHLHTIAAAAAQSSEATGVSGSYTNNVITDTLSASVLQSNIQASDLTVQATDNSSIDSLAGAAGVGQTAGVGAAIATNRIHNTVSAKLLGGKDNAGQATTVRVQNLWIEAASDETTQSIAVGLAGSSASGLAGGGSVAVNLSGSQTQAAIDGSADVDAANNVGVVASNNDKVAAWAGGVGLSRSGLGVGTSTSVNQLSDQTSATVGGHDVAGLSATSVIARGADTTHMMDVSSGELQHTVSLLDSLTDSAGFTDAGLAETRRYVNGLAVNASSLQTLSSAAVSVGGGKSAAAAQTSATNQIGGSTTAEINAADINQIALSTALIGRDVDVQASTHAASSSLVGALAFSGGASGGVGIDTESVSGSTTARVIDSQLSAVGKLGINAQSSATIGALAAGVAIGKDFGGAGTGLVVQLGGNTVAALVGNAVEVGSVSVHANSQQTVKLIGGSIGGGASAGLGAVFAVVDSHQTTQAYIGDAYALPTAAKNTVLRAYGDVDVEATTTVDNALYIASAGVSGEVGLGLTAGVLLNENKTEAQLAYVGMVGSPELLADGALNVHATEQDINLQAAGALGAGVGATGIGATAAVTIARAQVLAQIRDSQVASAGLKLFAENHQDISHTAISVGAGAGAGVAGTVSLIQLGSGNSADGTGLSGSGGALGSVNAMTSNNNTGDTGGILSADEQTALVQSTRVNLDPNVTLTAGLRNTAIAYIANSKVKTTDALNNLDVQATVSTKITNIAGSAAVGVGAGVGGAVTLSSVYNNVQAGSDSQSVLDSAGGLNVTAESLNGGNADAITSQAIAGGLGTVGLGAAVGLANINNAVLADVGGTVKANGDAMVMATDSNSMDVQAISVAAGYVAGGLTYVEAAKGGSVRASFNPEAANNAANAGSIKLLGYSVLTLEANSSGRINAEAHVGAGGIGLAVGGNHAAATDSVDVTAEIGAGASVIDQASHVSALRTPQVRAHTYSVGVAGGVQVGVSESDAKITGTTLARVGDNVGFDSQDDGSGNAMLTSLTIRAYTLKPADADSADATAFAAGGGALAGVNGALAFAGNNSNTKAQVGKQVRLPLDYVAILARADSSQHASASGVTVGGVLGAGADYAEASSNRNSEATLGGDAVVLLPADLPPPVNHANLSIQASGTDDNQAYATAGVGGMLAGAAAVAVTSAKGATSVKMEDSSAAGAPTLLADNVKLSAKHSSQFFSQSDAVQGSLAGASGASSTGDVDYTVAVDIGDHVLLNASDIRIEALNAVVESALGDNAKGASGGALAGAGMSSVNHIDSHTHVTIGDDAELAVVGDPLSPLHGDLVVVVGNTVRAADAASVSAGGAIAALVAESKTYVSSDNSITVGQRSKLDSMGNLDLGTYSTADIQNDSYAHGYGFAGGAGGNSTSDINVQQTVTIKADAKLDAWGNLSLSTGQADGGVQGNVLQARASNQVYFDGAFNGTDPHGEANIHNNATISVAAGVTLDSVRDIALNGVAGVTGVAASGEGHYTILGIPVSNSDQSSSNDGTQALIFNGTATAGTHHEVLLEVDPDGAITQQYLGGVKQIADYTPVKNLQDQIKGLTLIKSDLSTVDQADVQAQIDTLNALITTLNGRGLFEKTQISATEVQKTLAAGGNIDLSADHIAGSGTLTAWGGPTIKLHNASTDFLVVDQLLIPNELGGNVRMHGTAQAPVGMAIEYNKNAAASIDISNTYDTAAPGQTSAVAPAIFLTNSIESSGGSLSIYNKSGDLGQFGTVTVGSMNVQLPNGAFIVNTPGAGWALSGDPQATYGASGAIKDTIDTTFGGVNYWNYLYQTSPGVYLPGGSAPSLTPSTLGSDVRGYGNLGSADEAITLVANAYAQTLAGYTSANSATNYDLGHFLAGSPHVNVTTNVFRTDFTSGPGGGTGHMFFYPGNGYQLGSSGSYIAAYKGDMNIDGYRYNLPYIGVRKLVNQVATMPQPAITTGDAISATPNIRVGTNAIINAKFININGSIKAGLAHDFSATISDVVGTAGNSIPVGKTFIECIDDVVCRPNLRSFLAPNGLYKYPSSGIALANASDTAVDVYYDPGIRQLVLQNISGGGAGSVTLRGDIINTNNSTTNQSSIDVATGYAKVDIVNNTSTTLQTRDINTGDGNLGVVKITDTLKKDSSGNALTTWYVNRLGQGTSKYESSTATDFAGLTAVASDGHYAPTAGERYYWKYDADLSRVVTNVLGDWSQLTTSPWAWTKLPTNSAHALGDVWKISNGISNDISLTGIDFQQSFSGTASGSSTHITYADGWNWTWDVMSNAHITSTVSMKADFGINVGFDKGHQAGEVSVVAGKSSLLLGGKIQNINGKTTLIAYDADATVKANAKGAINTQSLAIGAGAGIGTLNDPLNVTLTNALTALPGLNKVSAISKHGDIGLALSGADAVLSNISTDASGDVLVHASGNLSGDFSLDPSNGQALFPVAVTGRNITLGSDSGSIGSIADPLVIQTLASINAQTGAISGGLLNANAQVDIGIQQAGGDLYLGHVSAGRDVKLVAAGNLLDGRTLEPMDRSAELAAVWDKMQLHASSNDRSAVVAFENTVNGNYSSYWSLVSHGSVVNGNLVLDAQGIQALQAQADQSLQAQTYVPAQSSPAPLVSATVEQVRAYAQTRYLDLSAAIVAARSASTDSLAYQTLLQEGTINNGSIVLSANGLSTLRTTVSTTVGHQANDSEVRAYAQVQYNTLRPKLQTEGMAHDYFNAAVADNYKLFNLGAVDGGNYLLSAQGVVALQAQADLSLGKVASAAEVQSYAAQRYSELVAASAVRFTASSDQIAALTRGQYWSDDALLYQINASALQAASNVVTAVNDVNVTGRNVTLVSTNAGIGKLGASVRFDLGAGLGANLTTEQKAALAAANSVGDLVEQVYTRNGQVDRACSAVFVDCKLVSFGIKQTHPLFLNVNQALRGSAATDAFMHAQGSLPVAGINAKNSLLLVSENGMSNVADFGTPAVSAITLNLQNGSGSIGSAVVPLSLKVTGQLQSARSGNGGVGDIYLDVVSGNLSFLDLYAADTLSIKTRDTAPGMGNVFSTNAIDGKPQPSVAAQSLVLDTTGSVYQDTNGSHGALITRLGSISAPGQVLGMVGGNIDLLNENAFTVGTLQVAGNAGFATDSADVTVEALRAANVSIASATGKILGLQRQSGSAENIYSDGTVTLNGGAQNALAQGGGIGQDSAHRLLVSAQNLDASAETGDIFIGLANHTFTDRTASIDSKAGMVDLDSSVDFIASHITSATASDIRLSTTGTARMRLANVSAGRDLLLNSVDGVFVIDPNAQIAATRDLVLTMSGNGTLTDATVSGASSGSLFAGRNIVLNAAALSVQELTAAGGIDLTARTGDITYTKLHARGGSLTALAQGSITGNAGGQADASADVTLNAHAIALADVQAGQDLVINVDEGNLSTRAGSTVAATRDLRLTLAGTAVLDDAIVSGLTTGRDAYLEAAALKLDHFAAGHDLNLLARAGDINYTTLRATGGALTARASGDLLGASGGTMSAGGDIALAATGMHLPDVQAGGDMRITTSNGDVAYTQLSASGSLQALVAGALNGDAGSVLQAGNGATVVADSAHFDRIVVGSAAQAADLSVKVQGALSAMSAEVWRDLDASAATIDLHDLHVHGNGVASASVDFKAGSLTVDGNLLASAGNTFSADTLGVGGKLDANALVAMGIASGRVGSDATLTSGSMTLGDLSAGNDLVLKATAGDLHYNNLGAGRDVNLQVSGALVGSSAGVLQAGNGATVVADSAHFDRIVVGSAAQAADLSVKVQGALSAMSAEVWRDLDASAATIDLHDLHVHGNGVASASGDFKAGSLTVDGNLLASAGNTFSADTLGVGGKLDANALVAMGIASGRVGSDATLTSGSMTLGDLSAGNDLVLKATAGDLHYNNLGAGRDVNLQVSGALVGSSAGVLQAQRDVTIAADSFEFGAVRAGNALSVTTNKGVQGNLLASGGAMDLQVATTVAVAEIAAGGPFGLSANGNIDIGKLTGTTLALTTPGNITLNEVHVEKSIALAADNMVVSIMASGPNPVQIDATGFRAGIASTVALTVATPAGLSVKRLYANHATIDSSSAHNAIADARIGTLLTYRTPTGTFQVSGVIPTFVPGLLAQFYQPALQPFFQKLDGRNFLTNAFVLQLDQAATANSVSYNQDHRDSSVPGVNASALRDTLLLSPFDWTHPLGTVAPVGQEKKPVRLEDGSMDAVNVGQL